MTNKVSITVEGTNNTGALFKTTNGGLDELKGKAKTAQAEVDKLGSAAGSTARQVVSLDHAAESASHATDELAGNTKQASNASETLRGRIADLRSAMALTAAEIANTDGDTKQLSGTFRSQQQEAARLGALLRALGEDERAAGSGADKLADNERQAARSAAQLRDEVLTLRAAMAATRAEFAATGNTGLTTKYKEQGKALQELKNAVRDVDSLSGAKGSKSLSGSLFGDGKAVLDDAEKLGKEGASTFASAWQGGIMDTFKALPGEAKIALAASLVAVAVAVTPIIIETITTGLLLGIGAGGLIAGIKLAAKDPQVSAAFTSLGADIKTDLTGAVKPFRGELLTVASTFRAAWQSEMPHVLSIFSNLSTVIAPLGQGFADAFKNAMPGLDAAIKASLPLFKALADSLPAMGAQVGKLFGAIAAAGPGAALVFKFLLMNVNALILGFRLLIEAVAPFFNTMAALTKILQSYRQASDESSKTTAIWVNGQAHASTATEGLRKNVDALGRNADGTAVSFRQLSLAVDKTADTADTVAGKMTDKLLDTVLGLGHATLSAAEGLTNMKDALRENGHSFDINTKAGQKNMGMLLSFYDANKQVYDSVLANTGSAEQATAAYNKNTQALRAQLKQAGLTEAQINDLIGTYASVPNTVNTNIATQGLTQAINSLTDMLAYLNHVNGYVARSSVIVTTDYVTNRSSVYNSQVPAAGRATGGTVGSSVPMSSAATGGIRGALVRVGESGPELVQLPGGSHVYSRGDSQRMEASWAGGSRGGHVTHTWEFAGNTDTALAQVIARLMRERKLTVRSSWIGA